VIRRIVLASALVFVTACSGREQAIESDRRVPDVSGIATNATLDRLEIDGDRSYEIDRSVESFLTRSHRISPILGWEGKYVHVGLDDDDRVIWIAGIGQVSGKPPTVFYSGVFESFDRSTREATFEDGTVLKFERGVEAPQRGREVVVQIDAGKDVVAEIVNQPVR
jgi:hypothetical protein